MPSLHDILLTLHVAAGSLGLVFGPLALWRSRGAPALPGSRTGEAYLWCVLVTSLTAVGLVGFDWPQLWWLTLLAAFAASLALLAVVAPGARFRGWERACAHGEGGSYIALVTALLVVSVEGPASFVAWTLPTLAGLPLIEVRAARLRERRCPPRARSSAAPGSPGRGTDERRKQMPEGVRSRSTSRTGN